MNHPSEEQLVLFHYGEAANHDEVAGHLGACDSCRVHYQALQRVLAAVDSLPALERADNYGQEVWRQLRPRLAERAVHARGRSSEFLRLFRYPRWALAGALGLLLLGSFLVGRFSSREPMSPPVARRLAQPVSPPARERVLLKEISDHLERSQMALIELINSKNNGAVDVSMEQILARELVAINRLFRRAAADAGEPGTANILEELETVLVEVANGPPKLSETEFAVLRQRIDSGGLLFKVKVLTAEMREKEQDTARSLARVKS